MIFKVQGSSNGFHLQKTFEASHTLPDGAKIELHVIMVVFFMTLICN